MLGSVVFKVGWVGRARVLTLRVAMMVAAALTASVLILIAGAVPASATVYPNTGSITIPTSLFGTNASPYPSTINVSGASGVITDINVTITGLSHESPDNIDILLVGPDDQSVMLMSDAGALDDVNSVNLTFDDEATGKLPDNTQITTGTYQPSDYQTGPGELPPPAPQVQAGDLLSAFDNANPNGEYKLFVRDDSGSSNAGQISGGWSLDITTGPPPPGAPGELDASFGRSGKVVTDFASATDEAQDLVVQSDGKVVVVGSSGGDFALARYNDDGSLDDGGPSDSTPGDSFGSGGKVTTDFGSSEDAANAVALDGNKIVVAGGAGAGFPKDFALARYNADGSLDDGGPSDSTPGDSFGSGGKVTTDFNSTFDEAYDLVLQGNKIVAAGTSSTGSEDFALARYNDDGSLDDGGPSDSTPGDSFGSGGKVTTDFGSGSSQAYALLLQGDKIVAAGYLLHTNTADFDFALARYNSDGSLDDTFDGDSGSGNGKVIATLGPSDDTAYALASQGDKILVAGRSFSAGYKFALIRLNTDGSLDTSFGTNGIVKTGFNSGGDQARDLAVQSDGRIVVAGYSFKGGTVDFALALFNPNGSLDQSFGTNGKVNTDFGSGDDFANAVAIQPDDKILTAGKATKSNADFALARYWNDMTPPDTTAPTVIEPLPTGKGVSSKATVTAKFSKAMDEASVEAKDPNTGKPTTFTLRRNGSTTMLSATVTYDPNTKTATLDPANRLRRGATYIATVTTAAKDVAGNPLDQDPSTPGNQDKTWTFKVRK